MPLGATGGDILIYKSIAVLAALALPSIAGVNWLLRGTVSWPQLAISAVLLASALACWALSRTGRREVAAALLIGLLWSATTIYAFESGYGMHSAVVFIYLPCVLYTALFFGVTIASAELALTVVALVLMYFAEEAGRLGGIAQFSRQGTNFNFLLGVILTSAGTLIVSVIYHRRIERDAERLAAEAEQRRIAMERAQLATAQLETANARLQALNEELAARGRQHALETVRARRDLDLYHDVFSRDLPASARALRAALAAPDERTEARLQQEIARIESVVGALGALRGEAEPELRREPLSLTALAQGIARELHARSRFARVRFDVDPNMQATGDRAQVAALLGHLIKRAAGACLAEPDPGVHVGSGSREGRSVFFVTDNGPGMDDAACERLFRPFERAGAQEDTVDIGIVSARRTAERHGGELFVESAPGHGTAYFFTLSAG
ncbi:MAG TPA: HAMP domain-containing sensor histidine kinase [Burkholderiales bacterium]